MDLRPAIEGVGQWPDLAGVAADIIRTVAVTPTLQSVAVLAVIVLIRTFLSFSLELEITGRWPWQKEAPETAAEPAR